MDGQHVQKSPYDLDVRPKSNCSNLCSNPLQVIKCSGSPSGIAIHDCGDIYVTCISDNGQAGQDQRRPIGRGRSGDGEFSRPFGIFIKGDVIYVAVYDNDRIQKLTIGGQFLQTIGEHGPGQVRLNGPSTVIVDHRDNMIVSEDKTHKVVILDQHGTWLLTISDNFQHPTGPAFDHQGNIHVAIFGSNIIKVFTPEGTYVRSYGSGDHLQGPCGIAFDEEGNTAVSELYGNCISIFDPQGKKTNGTVCNLNNPRRIFIDSISGSLYVANCNANTVLKYSVY